VETVPLAASLLGRRAELAGLAELLDGPGGSGPSRNSPPKV